MEWVAASIMTFYWSASGVSQSPEIIKEHWLIKQSVYYKWRNRLTNSIAIIFPAPTEEKSITGISRSNSLAISEPEQFN